MKYTFKPLSTREEWAWLSAKAQCCYCEDTKGIVAYREGEVVAAVALDSWSHNSVSIHIAITAPLVLKNGFAEEVFNYIFNTTGRRVVIGITPADNLAALKFNRHIGLVEVYRIKDGYAQGVDYVVQEIRKENCRYIEHGKEINSCAA